ncbi:hypothetical protein J7L48_00205, partial [bacterium]|nr:hypothetical protein [bacterium]
YLINAILIFFKNKTIKIIFFINNFLLIVLQSKIIVLILTHIENVSHKMDYANGTITYLPEKLKIIFQSMFFIFYLLLFVYVILKNMYKTNNNGNNSTK